MTSEQKEQLIKELCERHDVLEAEFDKVAAVMGDVANMPLHEEVWHTFSRYTEAVELLVGDAKPYSWLSWFIYDNDCGRRGLEAGYNKGMKPIRTVEQLVRLIEKEDER